MLGFQPISTNPLSDIAVFTPAAETIYYSRGSANTLPTGSNPGPIAFSATDYANVLTLNSVYVDEGSALTYNYMVFQIVHVNNTDQISISWTGKSKKAASAANVLLQIFNYSSGLWETLQTDSTTAAGTALTLTGTKSTSIANYYGGGNLVTCRVYQ